MYSLQVEDIHKRYDSREVLKGVSLRAGKGDMISIIGSSNSGKSTFLRCVNFLEKPCTGRIYVGDEELCTCPGTLDELYATDPRQLQRTRSWLVMVFQHFNLWSHPTVLENTIECPVNILRVNRDDAVVRTHYCLAKVDLAEKVGWQYPCGPSDGQQQRVTIARALAMEPQVMLFDEPTSVFDPELVGEVPKTTRQLAKEGRTMVLVTHEVAFVRQTSSHVIFLHQGMIEGQGAPDQVFGVSRSEHLHQFLASNPK